MTWWSQSELEAHLRIGPPDSFATAVTRSHLPDGRCVGWVGQLPSDTRLVIDAECTDEPVPEKLGSRFGTADFWERWTRAECAAKLTDTPMATWLQLHGMAGSEDHRYATVHAGWLAPHIVVSVGASRTAG